MSNLAMSIMPDLLIIGAVIGLTLGIVTGINAQLKKRNRDN